MANMKYYEFDKEEKQILADFDKDEFQSIKDFKRKKKTYESYAKNTLSKTKNINIRLAEKDLQKLKSLAAKRGLPYQTLAASILHRFTNR